VESCCFACVLMAFLNFFFCSGHCATLFMCYAHAW
jgi:hypothetical protein